jgi:hypothetical protein
MRYGENIRVALQAVRGPRERGQHHGSGSRGCTGGEQLFFHVRRLAESYRDRRWPNALTCNL